MWDRGCWLFIRLSLTSCNVKTHGGWWRAITMTNWNGARSLSSQELTPRLAWWAGGGSGEPQAGKVGQWCLVFTMCPVSSVQCPVSHHGLVSPGRGRCPSGAGSYSSYHDLPFTHCLDIVWSGHCVVEPLLVSSECWKASCDHFS